MLRAGVPESVARAGASGLHNGVVPGRAPLALPREGDRALFEKDGNETQVEARVIEAVKQHVYDEL